MALTFVSRTIKLIAILAVGVSPYCAVASSVAPTKTSNYVIDKNVVIHADDGATLCALVVRPASAQRSPTALEFTIYVDPKKDLSRLEYAAIRGYAGVMAYTRGKGECIRQTQKSCLTRTMAGTQTASSTGLRGNLGAMAGSA